MAKAMWGGLLSGVGQGIVTQAEQMRQDALERAKMLQRTTERAEDRAFQKEDQGAQRAFTTSEREARQTFDREQADAESTRQKGLFPDFTGTDKQGNTVQVNKQGEKRTIEGVAPTAKGSKTESGMSAGEARIISTIEPQYTTYDPISGKPVSIDSKGMAKALTEAGHPELAKLYSTSSETPAVSDNAGLWKQAQAEADAWVNRNAGWFSFDSSDFKEYGGSREKARDSKAQEIYERLIGGKPAQTEPSQATSKPADKSKPSGPAASGSLVRDEQGNITGSRPSQSDDEPVQVSSKAQRDALPSGTLYIDPTGQVRRKP